MDFPGTEPMKKRAFRLKARRGLFMGKVRFMLLQHSAGGHVMGVPISGGDGGYAGSVHGRCIMYDFSATYVNAYVINDSGGACPEKDQVTLFQIASGNRCACALLILGAPL